MTEQESSRGQSVLWFALGLGTVGLAVWLVVRDQAARDAVAAIDVLVLVAVGLFQLGNVTTDSIRYRMTLPEQYRSVVPPWPWHRIFSVGRFLNGLVPQAGSAYRAAHLKLEFGVPVSAFLGSVLAISWLGNGIALGVAGLVVLAAGATGTGVAILGAGIATILVVGVAPRFRFAAVGGLARLVPRRLAVSFGGLGEGFSDLARGRGRLVRVLGVSVVTQLTGAVAYVLVAHALEIGDPIVAGVALYAGTTVATTVALTPGGLGIAELAAAAVGSAIDIGAGMGVLAALVIRLTGKVALAVLALVSTVASRRSRAVAPSGDS